MMFKSILTGAAAALLGTSALHASELLTNGDFSGGNTGFASTYSYNSYSAAQGTYYLTGNAANICGCFNNLADHTSGSGTLMVLDGAQSGLDFFSETFAVSANTNYTLSYWASQLGGGPQAVIAAMVNGSQVGSNFVPSQSGWQNYTVSFNSGLATSVTLGLRDLETNFSYNDFAIDDVSVVGEVAGAVPEPATWALMIGGFAMTGASMRRRSTRVVAA